MSKKIEKNVTDKIKEETIIIMTTKEQVMHTFTILSKVMLPF